MDEGKAVITSPMISESAKEPLDLSGEEVTQNLEVLRSEANLGFTGGNNLGIRHAIEHYNSDYILLLNNDTVVSPDFLKGG